jgi:hypothetical protein
VDARDKRGHDGNQRETRICSPDEAQRNPGRRVTGNRRVPDYASAIRATLGISSFSPLRQSPDAAFDSVSALVLHISLFERLETRCLIDTAGREISLLHNIKRLF